MLENNDIENIIEQKESKENKENIKFEISQTIIDSLYKKFHKFIIDENQLIIEDIPKYLNIIYLTLRKDSLIDKEKALILLETIINRINRTNTEYNFLNDTILEKSMIFFLLIKLYLCDNTQMIRDILTEILKFLLIGNVEMIETLLNLFPISLFEKIQADPSPFNWINEWDEFLLIIKQSFSEAKLIWNKECRNELINYLENKCKEFDDINFEKKITNDIIEQDNKENVLNNMNLNLEEKYIISDYKYEEELFEKINKISTDYKSIKMHYNTLNNEIFIWKYYLRKLIKEEKEIPSFVIDIDKPKKFWKLIKVEICLEKEPERIVIMLKVMILLYKNYYSKQRKTRKEFKPLGNIKDYDFFINLYQSYDDIEVKSYIIQLLYLSVTYIEKKTENKKELLLQDDIGSVILSYITLIESTIKNESYSINFDIEEYSKKYCNNFYIDREKAIIKFSNTIEYNQFVFNEKNFINYANYYHVDEESWSNSDDAYKLLCIACSLYYILKKQCKRNIKENKNELPVFPIPQITRILYNKNNYRALLKLLLYENFNLSYQALNLFTNHIIDLLNDNLGGEFCLVDILFILMIKYKSSKLLKNLDKISYYCMKKSKKTVYEDLKLSEEEIEYFEYNSSSDRVRNSQIKRKPIILLIRYFPLQIVNYLYTHKFEEFINLIYTKEDINTYEIKWNRKMLDDLLKSVRNLIFKNIDKLTLDKNYRYDYSEINKKEKSFYIYYIKDNTDNILKCINDEEYLTMINTLCLEKYLVEFDYMNLLYKILEKFNYKLTKETKDKIKIKISSHLYPNNISDMANNPNIKNKEFDLNLLKCYIKILALIDENENNILKYNNHINLTINKILSLEKLSFNEDDNNAKILLVLLNYLLEQPKIKSLLEILENEKEVISNNNESEMDEDNQINIENNIIKNQEEYDNKSKIVQQISRYADNIFELNPSLFIAFLKYFTFLCEKDNNIINYINMTILPLQLLRLCTRYKPSNKIPEKNNIFFVIFRALRTMLTNNQYLNEIMEKLLDNKRLMNIFLGDGTSFLKELTQGHMRPKSIWSKKDLELLVKFLDKSIDDYFVRQKNVSVIYNKIRESEKKEINDELKIGNIYIRIYNMNPKQRHCFEENEKETFLSKLFKEFITQENLYNLKHILWSICNTMELLQFDKNFLFKLPFNELLTKFYSYSYHITHFTKEEKDEFLKYEEDEAQIFKTKDPCPKSEKIANICLQFIEIISKNEQTIFNMQETNMIYSFILLIEFTNHLESLKIICKIMDNIFKGHNNSNIRGSNPMNQNIIINPEVGIENYSIDNLLENNEKRIKSIFLFLFKKLLFYSQNKKNISEEENSHYMDLFLIINNFANSKYFDLGLKELYRYYIPVKMIENLFNSISKEQRKNEKAIQKLFNDWLRDKIDFPDLKWNTNSFNRSYKLLCDDCQMILKDKSLIDNFEKIYIETDRITENKIFFENPDEYKVDNIYLRLFNRESNYNIGRNLPTFLLHIIDDMLDHLYDYFIFNYGNYPDSDMNLIDKIKKFKEKCLVTSLTSIMLIIEQINFNHNNPNLILAANKDLNNPIFKKEEFQNEIIQLVKLAFDYQKLLSEDNCKALIQMQKIIFFCELDKESKEYKIYFNPEIRVLYLQILYLISENKYRVEYLSENFEENIILDFYFDLLLQDQKENKQNNQILILDYEYILVCCLLNKLISIDISHIPIILAEYLDKFWNLSIKRPNIKKYIQILFKNIESDSQYGNSLSRCKDTYNFCFDENLSINEAKIWRLECSEKKEIKYDKKNIHYCNYNDFIEANNKGIFNDYEFPIILDKSINYFKYDEYTDDLIDSEVKKIKDYEQEHKNATFISMKDLLDQMQNI